MARLLPLKKWIARLVAIAVIVSAAIPAQSHFAYAADPGNTDPAGVIPCHQSASTSDSLAGKTGLSGAQCQSFCASASLTDAGSLGPRFEKLSCAHDFASIAAVRDLPPRATAAQLADPSRLRERSRPPSLIARNHRLLI
ncbi:MAG: hypothetical protein KDE14_00335 [Rhodobacteraceae bacterium]|nr:hypothetical protein [Paracoccaceae bacterium]